MSGMTYIGMVCRFFMPEYREKSTGMPVKADRGTLWIYRSPWWEGLHTEKAVENLIFLFTVYIYGLNLLKSHKKTKIANALHCLLRMN